MEAFLATFYVLARQLNTPRIAADWWALAQTMPLTGTEAAQWANLGYLPGEAASELSAGVDLAQARRASERAGRAHIWRNGERIA